MPRFEIVTNWINELTPKQERSCGPCYACCVWLGIEELRKHTGQTCKHLCGGGDGTKRCSIYPDRPKACVDYECMWRAGWGPDELRPYESGMLITPYPNENNPKLADFTINVFDRAKAQKHVMNVLGELSTLPDTGEIRLIYIETKSAILMKDGNIYRAKLLPPDGFESLMFMADDDPIGRYAVETRSNPVE